MQTQTTTATTYFIRSSRDPNRFYTVALNPRGFYECSCPAASFNRRTPCKHVKAVAKQGAGLVATPKRAATRQHAAVSAETRDALAAMEV